MKCLSSGLSGFVAMSFSFHESFLFISSDHLHECYQTNLNECLAWTKISKRLEASQLGLLGKHAFIFSSSLLCSFFWLMIVTKRRKLGKLKNKPLKGISFVSGESLYWVKILIDFRFEGFQGRVFILWRGCERGKKALGVIKSYQVRHYFASFSIRNWLLS